MLLVARQELAPVAPTTRARGVDHEGGIVPVAACGNSTCIIEMARLAKGKRKRELKSQTLDLRVAPLSEGRHPAGDGRLRSTRGRPRPSRREPNPPKRAAHRLRRLPCRRRAGLSQHRSSLRKRRRKRSPRSDARNLGLRQPGAGRRRFRGPGPTKRDLRVWVRSALGSSKRRLCVPGRTQG